MGVLALTAAAALWRDPAGRKGLFIGGVAAWAVSSLSVVALLVSKAHESIKAFWWVFGAGLGLRLATLVALMVYGALCQHAFSLVALLLTYAVGVLFFLLLEYRYIKIE